MIFRRRHGSNSAHGDVRIVGFKVNASGVLRSMIRNVIQDEKFRRGEAWESESWVNH